MLPVNFSMQVSAKSTKDGTSIDLDYCGADGHVVSFEAEEDTYEHALMALYQDVLDYLDGDDEDEDMTDEEYIAYLENKVEHLSRENQLLRDGDLEEEEEEEEDKDNWFEELLNRSFASSDTRDYFEHLFKKYSSLL